MAIKGLTDKQAAFPIIGELRKGAMKPKTGNRPGEDLTFFRFTSDTQETIDQFYQYYTATPRSINIWLPCKTADENMESWIEKWVAGGLVYRSDGEQMVLWRKPNGGFSTEPKPDPAPEEGEDGKRKDGSGPVGRLSVIITEMGRLATVTALTTSKHDIINLTRQLRIYESINGDLRGIPFVLIRKPQMISTPASGGKRVRREKWLLSIETNPRWTMARLQQMEREALPAGDDIYQPSAGVYELPAGISAPDDEMEPEEPEPVPAPKWATIDDFLHDAWTELRLTEGDARAELRRRGFGWPKNGGGDTKKAEMWQALVDYAAQQPVVDEPVDWLVEAEQEPLFPPPAPTGYEEK